MLTMVWIITFRLNKQSPQQEIKKYTKEAADHFAEGIMDAGGVAVVTEDVETDIPADDETFVTGKNTLDWNS